MNDIKHRCSKHLWNNWKWMQLLWLLLTGAAGTAVHSCHISVPQKSQKQKRYNCRWRRWRNIYRWTRKSAAAWRRSQHSAIWYIQSATRSTPWTMSRCWQLEGETGRRYVNVLWQWCLFFTLLPYCTFVFLYHLVYIDVLVLNLHCHSYS